jgi:lantibiotic transport system permease protein
MTAAVAFPFFIILICTLLPQIEHRNNTWKQLLTSPQTKLNIFLAKFANAQFFIILFLLLNRLIMFLVVVLLHFREPELNVLRQPLDESEMTMSFLNSYIAMLAVFCLQFWLGLRFRNFIVPVGIGISLWFLGSILVLEMKSPLANYFPYSFHMFKTLPDFKVNDNAIRLTSFAYAVLFLVIGYIDFKRRGK